MIKVTMASRTKTIMNISKIEGTKDMAGASLFAVLGLAGSTGSITDDFRDDAGYYA
jgi:hypothetical protein